MTVLIKDYTVELLYHALGCPRGGPMPKEFYRNYYCAVPGGQADLHLKELEVLGIVRQSKSNVQEPHNFYGVTQVGVAFLRAYNAKVREDIKDQKARERMKRESNDR